MALGYGERSRTRGAAARCREFDRARYGTGRNRGGDRLSLSQEERSRLNGASSVDPQVYELCLLGRYEGNKRTEDGLVKSIGYFRRQLTAILPMHLPMPDWRKLT